MKTALTTLGVIIFVVGLLASGMIFFSGHILYSILALLSALTLTAVLFAFSEIIGLLEKIVSVKKNTTN